MKPWINEKAPLIQVYLNVMNKSRSKRARWVQKIDFEK